MRPRRAQVPRCYSLARVATSFGRASTAFSSPRPPFRLLTGAENERRLDGPRDVACSSSHPALLQECRRSTTHKRPHRARGKMAAPLADDRAVLTPKGPPVQQHRATLHRAVAARRRHLHFRSLPRALRFVHRPANAAFVPRTKLEFVDARLFRRRAEVITSSRGRHSTAERPRATGEATSSNASRTNHS